MYFKVALKLILEIKLSIAGMGLILRGNRFTTPFFISSRSLEMGRNSKYRTDALFFCKKKQIRMFYNETYENYNKRFTCII
jgi:hypothetical protein